MMLGVAKCYNYTTYQISFSLSVPFPLSFLPFSAPIPPSGTIILLLEGDIKWNAALCLMQINGKWSTWEESRAPERGLGRRSEASRRLNRFLHIICHLDESLSLMTGFCSAGRRRTCRFFSVQARRKEPSSGWCRQCHFFC